MMKAIELMHQGAKQFQQRREQRDGSGDLLARRAAVAAIAQEYQSRNLYQMGLLRVQRGWGSPTAAVEEAIQTLRRLGPTVFG